MLLFKVISNETGDVYSVRVDRQDFTLNAFKNGLATFSGISIPDQIILIGPPYKRIDSQFSTEMQDAGQKIFLYNRRVFTDNDFVPLPTTIKPNKLPDVDLSNLELSIASFSLDSAASPLIRALPDYERRYLTQIKIGESILSTAEQILTGCKRCLEQSDNQIASVQAAIVNLNDHYESTKASFEVARQHLIEQQSRHKELLNGFEDKMMNLSKIPIHPSLRVAMENAKIAKSADQNASRLQIQFETLIDTIPLDKERLWRDNCAQAHQKVEDNMAQLRHVFEQVTQSLSTLAHFPEEFVAIETKKNDLISMTNHLSFLREQMQQLRDAYHTISEKISHYLTDSHGLSKEEGDMSRSGTISGLLQELEDGRIRQEDQVLKVMKEVANKMLSLKEDIAQTKSKFDLARCKSMRDIAVLQTDIQYKLKKSLELMKKWKDGHNGYFQHLEYVCNLSETYEKFLQEIVRRKRAAELFENLIDRAKDAITNARENETKLREEFMKSVGAQLPPIFFDAVPTIADKPQYFEAKLTEKQWLPEVAESDLFGKSSDDTEFKSGDSSLSNSLFNEENVITESNQTETVVVSNLPLEEDVINNRVLEKIEAYQAAWQAEAEEKERKYQELEAKFNEVKAKHDELVALNENLKPVPETYSIGTPIHSRKSIDIASHSKNINYSLDEMLSGLFQLQELLGIDPSEQKRQGIEPKLSQHQIDEALQIVELIRKATSDIQSLPNKDIKIAFLNFKEGDLAFFLPTKNPDLYRAFDAGVGLNTYLARGSLASFKQDNRSPSYILGQVVHKEKLTTANRHQFAGVPPETAGDIYILFVEKWSISRPK